MAFNITTLLFKYRAMIDSLTIDASISEGHEADVEVTEHAVEVGANISDHARVKPETLSMECVITATPLYRESSLDYIESAYAKLRQLKDDRQLIKIVTGLRTYDNMIMTKLSVPRNAQTGDSLRFSVSFKEIILATVDKRDVIVAKSKTKDKGKQATPPVSEDKRSYLEAIKDNTVGRNLNDVFGKRMREIKGIPGKH